MKTQTILAMLLLAIIAVIKLVTMTNIDPNVGAALAVEAVNGGNKIATDLRTYFETRNALDTTLLGASLSVIGIWLAGVFRHFSRKKKSGGVTTCLIAILALTSASCRRPYDKPEYVEIDNNETAFVLPLEGDTKNQAKFQSEDFLKEKKVGAKRVQITHRWSQTGRLDMTGEWIPNVRVVKVDRSPETREWKAPETTSGHVAKGAGSDKAIWVESADSVGFSMGFNCTAYVKEEDAAKFLYWYPSASLANVMDTEIRARIQQNAAEVAAKYPLDELRTRKQEIADKVREDATTFFAERGITVTTIGMFGGMTYENPQIQDAIDKVFVSQQEKNVAKAKWEAQQKLNETIQLEATALAEKKRIEAKGEADAITQVQEAINKAQSSPLYLQLKTLEVQKTQIEKWNGEFPTYFMGGSADQPSLLLNLPVPQATQMPVQPAAGR